MQSQRMLVPPVGFFRKYDTNTLIMAMSELTCRKALPRQKAYKLSDSGGLHLLVQPNGSRLWRLAYRFGGKQKTLAFGKYPAVSLTEARVRREKAKEQLAGGRDPALSDSEAALVAGSTFKQVAEQWKQTWQGNKTQRHVDRVWGRLLNDVFPSLGERGVGTITPPEVLAVVRMVEQRGALDVARRIRQCCNQIFRFAIASGLIRMNPAADIGGAMQQRRKVRHMARLPLSELPALVRNIAAYDGDPVTAAALGFTLLTWVRTNETRFAIWGEFGDLDAAEPLWIIPAARMKMEREHLVPLAPQAVAVLKQLRGERLPALGDLVFTGVQQRAMSENTMLFALYRMGYHSRATVHGFRGMASTAANEHGWNRDWIERQLAHVEGNEVRGAYNAAEWIPGRRQMLEWWADEVTKAEAKELAVVDEFEALLL